MEQYTVALLHAQSLLRRSMARMLCDAGPFRLLAEAADAPTFKRAFALGGHPQLVLLCWTNANTQDQVMLHWLRCHMPNCRVLVLGHNDPPEQLLPLMRAGAHGYLCGSETPEVLGSVLKSLLCGARHFPQAVWERIHLLLPANPMPATTRRRPSPAECEFLTHLAAPDHPTCKQVAERTGRSVYAIEKYRNEMCIRYGVRGKAGLIDLAKEFGLA